MFKIQFGTLTVYKQQQKNHENSGQGALAWHQYSQPVFSLRENKLVLEVKVGI